MKLEEVTFEMYSPILEMISDSIPTVDVPHCVDAMMLPGALGRGLRRTVPTILLLAVGPDTTLLLRLHTTNREEM